jgi:hypothetical protein
MAQRYGISVNAVETMLSAVSAGGGTMAQFYHQELGGGGQWMQGGMTMVGDMFNSGLQSTVSNLCSELSSLLSSTEVFVRRPPNASGSSGSGGFGGNNWWPEGLGQPSSSGGQNDCRYAYFPSACRLLIERGGNVKYYDTLNHQIGGVQQQQGSSPGGLSFSSQFGTFTVDSLPMVDPGPSPVWDLNAAAQRQTAAQQPPPPQQSSPQPAANSFVEQPHDAGAGTISSAEVLTAIERLGQLYQQGVLSQSEFESKKSQLLARL